MAPTPQNGQAPEESQAALSQGNAGRHQAAVVAATQEMLDDWGDVLERLGTV